MEERGIGDCTASCVTVNTDSVCGKLALYGVLYNDHDPLLYYVHFTNEHHYCVSVCEQV